MTTRAAPAALTAGWRAGDTSVRAQFSHAIDERGVPGPFGTNPIGAFEAIDTISRGDNGQTLAVRHRDVAAGASRPLGVPGRVPSARQ